MDSSGQKLWTKGFVLAIGVNLFISMVFFLLVTTMALYAVERFQAGEGLAGLASSSFIIGGVVARIFTGKFLDFLGRRQVLVLSLVVFVAASLLYIPADTLGTLLVVRFIHGLAFGAGTTAVSASVIGLIPAWRRGEGMGYFATSTTLSTAAGPLMAVLLVESAGYEALFLFSAVCSSAGLGIALVLWLPERTPTPNEQADKWRLRLTDVLDFSALPTAAVMFVSGVAFSGVLTFLSSYAGSEDMASAVSAFFLVYAAVVLVSRLLVGRIQDSRGDNAVVYPTLVSFTLGLGLLAVSPNGIVLMVAGVFMGLGFGALMPCVQAIAITAAPDHRVGIATSTFFLLLDAGSGLGPLLLGALIPLTGYRGMYLALAAAVLASTVLYHFVHGYKRYIRQALA